MMNSKVTVVTGLIDIKRENLGDGRKIEDYVKWLKLTMKLNVPMVIYCERSIYDMIHKERLEYDNFTKYIIISKDDIEYLKYTDTVNQIVKRKDYLERIMGRDRLEVKLPIYNLLIINKTIWLKNVSDNNYFNSEYFLWMDAGCSRFFEDYDISKKLQWPNIEKLHKTKLNIQIKQSLLYNMSLENLLYHCDHFTTATIFGGCKEIIARLAVETKTVFDYMINNNCINNEQIIFAIIFKRYPELFHGIMNNTNKHLPYFQYLSY